MLMNICYELQWRLLCCSNIFSFSQFSSFTESYPTLCDPVDCSMPGFPVHHQLPELGQVHVHRVVAAIQPSHPLSSPSPLIPSNHLILCRPLLLPSIFPSIRLFSNEVVLRIRWPKCWSFSFSISPFNEYSGLISSGILVYFIFIVCVCVF